MSGKAFIGGQVYDYDIAEESEKDIDNAYLIGYGKKYSERTRTYISNTRYYFYQLMTGTSSDASIGSLEMLD